MATHRVDTDALDRAAMWLEERRHEVGRLACETQGQVERTLHESYRVPGVSPASVNDVALAGSACSRANSPPLTLRKI